MRERIDLRGLTLAELEQFVLAEGWPRFRAQQIFQWLQQKGVATAAEMVNLPLALRQALDALLLPLPTVLRRHESAAADTVKLLLEYGDGARIETVLMLYARAHHRDRVTCCLSTQSGCAMGCAFCATGQFKQPRNLSAGEIVAQAILAAREARQAGYAGLSNLVYMGMGEPLCNLEAVKKSILLLNDAAGLNIGQRRITVSTCGLIPQIRQMAAWGLQIGLALSLHSADQALREQLMPVARQHPLPQLIAACRDYRQQTGRRVTVEYALFAGVNDSPAAAAALVELLAGEDLLVNLIPANSVPGAGFSPSKGEIIEAFAKYLTDHGLETQLREARGQDIAAACGQLRASEPN